MALPLEFPPSPLVRGATEFFDSSTHDQVLDIGSHTGRNSLYLAELGHHVIGLTDELQDARDATELAKLKGVDDRCAFVVADGRHLPFRDSFDVVLMNEVLHMMPKHESTQLLETAQSFTRPGGINVVSGYLVKAEMQRDMYPRHFVPMELRRMYNGPEWEVLGYHEDPFKGRTIGSKEIVDSLVRLIARKR